jgi:hypothetical protein
MTTNPTTDDAGTKFPKDAQVHLPGSRELGTVIAVRGESRWVEFSDRRPPSSLHVSLLRSAT